MGTTSRLADLLRSAPSGGLLLSYRETFLWQLPLVLPLYRVGRDERNDIRLDDATVSARHALLTPFFQELLVEDLGSKNGVWYQNQRVTRARIKPGETVRIGHFRLRFVASPPNTLPWDAPEQSPTSQQAPIAQPRLVVQPGGQALLLSRRVTRLGNDPNRDPMLIRDGYRVLLFVPETTEVRLNGAVASGLQLLRLGDHFEWRDRTFSLDADSVSH